MSPGPGPGPSENVTVNASPPVVSVTVGNPKLLFAASYSPVAVSVEPSIPEYSLPLDTGAVANYETVTGTLHLTDDQKAKLLENGFVVIPHGWQDDIVAIYEDMKYADIPVFVTSDTLLHLYHIQFNELLKDAEQGEFYNEALLMSKAMLTKSAEQYAASSGDVQEAARRNVAFFAVAARLLDPSFNDIPLYVSQAVETELSNIEAHEGFKPSAIFNTNAACTCGRPPCYCEDYSQYVPRGHYTETEGLKRYFKAMMWYGRMAFLLKAEFVTEHDADIATLQAELIASSMSGTTYGGRTVEQGWNRIYSVTSFFVGLADDLTPYEYKQASDAVFGASPSFADITDEAKMLTFKAALAQMRLPKIYGGTGKCEIGPPITAEKLDECLDASKGMRFMGQRYVPDSYMFQMLVAPVSGEYNGSGEPFTMCMTQAGPYRCFPRGLDVAAVLGSERALEVLRADGDTDYANYSVALAYLQDEFAALNETDWNRNLYMAWMYALKSLLSDHGAGYPSFMQTDAWKDKALNAFLASWAELRHDTILYAKQSYTPGITAVGPPLKEVPGYVEPVPEFYSRMLALTTMTRIGLDGMGLLNETSRSRLTELESVLQRLIDISKTELENKELTEADYAFIRDFGDNLKGTVAGVNDRGLETTLVADVHSDINTEQALEEGTGFVNLIIVAYPLPDGGVGLGGGPVMSYYEFKQPISDRLTDEAWKEMLMTNPPEPPAFTESFRVLLKQMY